MTTLSVTLVRTADGSVDEDASLEACRTAVREYVERTDTLNRELSVAVHAVFDANVGVRMNMPFIVSEAMRLITYNPNDYARVNAAVGDFIRANAGAERESGALFHIGKGKGARTFRWSDEPLPASNTKK